VESASQTIPEDPPQAADSEPAVEVPELTVPLPRFAWEPSNYSNKFLVILSSSSEPNYGPPALQTLAEQRQVSVELARLSSSWFQGLEPCFEITVAGAFEYRRQATNLSRQLDGIDVPNEVKNAGRFVGTQEVVDDWCKNKPSDATAPCGPLRFAEVHDGRTWLWLGLDDQTVSDSLEGSEAPTALDGVSTWSAPLSAEQLGETNTGARYDLYAPLSKKALKSCAIKGFAALTRGTPHHSYLQAEPPASEPSCGQPDIFAELSCADAPDEPLIALPAGSKTPTLYTSTARIANVEMEDEAKSLVTRSAAFRNAFTAARDAASERNQPLQQLVDIWGYIAPDQKLLLVQVTLQTGDGVIWCGQDDFRLQLAGVFTWADNDRVGEELVPFFSYYNAEILTLIDVEADGRPELLQRAWPGRLLLVGTGEEACSWGKAYCDCPC